jgi:hypothetical protein
VTRADTLQALRAVVIALSGYDAANVVIGYGRRTRGNEPHISLQVVTDSRIGLPYRAHIDGTTVYQQRLLGVQIDAFGAATAPEAVGLLERVALHEPVDLHLRRRTPRDPLQDRRGLRPCHRRAC